MSYIKMENEHGGSMDIANQNLANNNLEIIRKITQILDDQMDSSNLANFMSQQTKATNSTLNTNAEAFYPSNTVTPVMCQNANYTPGGTMYTTPTHAMTNQPLAQTGQHVNNQELMAGLQKLGNLNWAAIQQAVAASKQQQHQQDPSSFIPGAISNRTLEHLTESMTRPARAIKGGDSSKTHIQQEHHTPAQNVGTIGDSRPSSTSNSSPTQNLTNAINMSNQHSQVSNNSVMNMVNQSALSALNNSLMGMAAHGPIGSPEPSIHGQQASTPAPSVMANSSGNTVMNMSMGSRSCTPESDTSGISSGGTSDVSDVALIDLMYNLNLGAKMNAHTQTTPPTLAPVTSSQQPIHSTSSVVQQLAAAATQQQQQHQQHVQQLQQLPQQQHQAYQAPQPVQQQHSAWQQAVAQPSQQHQQQQQQQPQNVYMYQQQQQPQQAHNYPQATTVAQSLIPYQQAIQIDSYAGHSQAPASLISPYVIQPAHIQPPVTSQQPAAVATTYPAISQYSNMDLLRMLACDMNNPAAATAASSYPSQLTPQPVQTVTPVHQVAPADFAQNMDLVTERSSNAKATTSALSSLFGPVGAGLTNFGTASAADQAAIEKAAKWYRGAASVYEATCTWSGQLPPKIYKNPTYSCKVFLGGVPWDITEVGLQNAFKAFGPTRIEWPQEGKHKIRNPMKAGYVYVLFETDKSVKTLLQSCTHDFSNGGEYYFKISSRRMRSKEVQVIPWVLSDSNYVKQPSQRLDPTKTVFVGALHGMMNAEGLAQIMNDLFGNVVYAGIDTDKHKYPIGSGRVTFSSHKSFMKAVNAAFVEVKTPKFTKKVQIDPYLEDSMCNSCASQAGPYFCRDLACFRYYCRHCWQFFHAIDSARHHKPLMRNNVRANAEV